ncbi:hypothetical protein [Salinicola acroporae]|uniref:hypothetical protein n=1 Tax=Salinicola acroporae TaxID=1541440 RepID=UPI001F0BB054|nr:hypothetical protein [Salinicola acroporae]
MLETLFTNIFVSYRNMAIRMGGTVGSGARSFAEDDPWLTAVLDAWHMSDQSLGTLMSEIEFRGDPVAGARTWLEENRDQVDEWLAAGERIQP